MGGEMFGTYIYNKQISKLKICKSIIVFVFVMDHNGFLQPFQLHISTTHRQTYVGLGSLHN